jgi:hypothetical protein
VRLFLVKSLEFAVRREGGLVRLPSPVVPFVSPHGVFHGDGFCSPSRLGCGVVSSESSELWSFVFYLCLVVLSLRLLWQEVLPEASGGVLCLRFCLAGGGR